MSRSPPPAAWSTGWFAGLVHRRVASHTRREVDLRLTPRGRRLLERYDTLRLESLQACLAQLPGGERDTATRRLRALATHVGV